MWPSSSNVYVIAADSRNTLLCSYAQNDEIIFVFIKHVVSISIYLVYNSRIDEGCGYFYLNPVVLLYPGNQ